MFERIPSLVGAVGLIASGSACTLDPGPRDIPVADTELRAVVEEEAVVAMAEDPLFAAWIIGLSDHAHLMLTQMVIPAYAEHGPSAGEHLFHRWANYRGAVQWLGFDASELTLANAPAFEAATGLPLNAVATSVSQAHALDAKYGLLSMNRQQLEFAVELALSNPAVAEQVHDGWSDPSVVIPLGAGAVDACVVECAERTADTWIVVSSAIYVLSEIFADLGVDLALIVAEGALVAVSAAALAACIDECGTDDNTCESDADCEPKEYCDKGWLTIGKNQCVFSRDEGEICTRQAQCKSGCCKYHLWSNPVHPVCRPDDKCE